MQIIGTDTEREVLHRAKVAYLRVSGTMASDASDVVERDGKVYVRLVNVDGLLTVYRVRVVNDAPMLKGLKRWPPELAD